MPSSSALEAAGPVLQPVQPGPPRSQAVMLSILGPVYNEQATVLRAIREVLETDYPCAMELIVVDDGSADQTGALLARVSDDRVVVHRHPVNQGKGAALRTATSLASGTHLLPFDADLEYVAADIPRLLEPILKGRCDIVYGARLCGYNTVYQSYRYALGNRMLTFLTNVLFNANLSDLHTCLKLVPAMVMDEFRFTERGFGLDTELTALLLRRRLRPFEVPVSYFSRSHAQGKKINWRDAVRCVWVLLRTRLCRRSRLIPGTIIWPDAVGPAGKVGRRLSREDSAPMLTLPATDVTRGPRDHD
jgi:glycosyltransferase involved in cell wall biosynthesis